ncbi:MAG: hypothetical protein D4R81_05005 [Nitrospiraceae bacterium]|nr:MAG: hypothetical protein D4R81_05005 [Nitrospiraceae bacterium]
MVSDKTIRILYGLALLLFIGGALDVSMFIMQRYDDFQKGLSDELALTGLGVWWVIALGLAGFAYTRSKKAGD